LAASEAPEKPQTATISLGAEFASGKYGTDSTTRSFYMPLIMTWFPTNRIDVGIEIPFIYQSSSNVTTDLYRNNQTVTAIETVARGGPGGSGGTIMQQQSGSSTVTSGTSDSAVSGIGDIILRLGVIALFEDKLLPQIRPSLFVKVPTANSSDGLGTGEYDAGIGVEASKWFGDAHLLGEAFYTWQGKATGFGLKNYVSYTVGAGYQLTDNVKPMLMIKGASAPSTYSDYLLETRAKVIWSVTNTTSVDLFVSHGISDSSPDYGGGLAIIYSF
jgi:Putative MetA-pathway of phenol degradation